MTLDTDRLLVPWRMWLQAVPWTTASVALHTRWSDLCSCPANRSCCIRPTRSWLVDVSKDCNMILCDNDSQYVLESLHNLIATMQHIKHCNSSISNRSNSSWMHPWHEWVAPCDISFKVRCIEIRLLTYLLTNSCSLAMAALPFAKDLDFRNLVLVPTRHRDCSKAK